MKTIYCYLSLSILSVLLLSRCGQKETESGLVEFSFDKSQNTSARTTEETITKIVISVETMDGDVFADNHEINISAFGTGYVSDPFLLTIGEYKITKFLVLNESDEIVYATPKEGSALAGLVSHPLPISFQVIPDQITKVGLEVIETASHDPEDLGYSTFSFNIIPTQEILISVMNHFGSGDYAFTNSELTTYFDGDSAFTIALGDSINVVKVRTDVAELLLKFTSESGSTKEILLGADTLDYYRRVPLTVIFEEYISLQPNGAEGKDAVLSYYYSNMNYGDEEDIHLYAGTISGAPNHNRVVIEFDLTELPVDASIDNALLSLYFNNSSVYSTAHNGPAGYTGATDFEIYRITTPWEESDVNYDSQPAYDDARKILVPGATTGTQDFLNINVTELIRETQLNRSSSHGFLIKLVDETPYRMLLIASSDHPDATVRPKLEIFYSTPD